jgi:hypothetical protein
LREFEEYSSVNSVWYEETKRLQSKNDNMNSAPVIKGGSTYVHVRDLPEALDSEVNWRSDIKQIDVIMET